MFHGLDVFGHPVLSLSLVYWEVETNPYGKLPFLDYRGYREFENLNGS